MNVAALAMLAAVMITVGLLRDAVTDMFKQEFTTRLTKLPKKLIKIAVRRLPGRDREEYSQEWLAELNHIVLETDGLPVARFIRGTRFAASILLAARAIRKAGVPEPEPKTTGNQVVSGTRRPFYLSRRAMRDLEARSRREEVMRNLRWGAELAVSEDAAKSLLGIELLRALRDAELLAPIEEEFVDAALRTVIRVPRTAIDQSDGDSEPGVDE